MTLNKIALLVGLASLSNIALAQAIHIRYESHVSPQLIKQNHEISAYLANTRLDIATDAQHREWKFDGRQSTSQWLELAPNVQYARLDKINEKTLDFGKCQLNLSAGDHAKEIMLYSYMSGPHTLSMTCYTH